MNKAFNGGFDALNRRVKLFLEPNSSAAVLDVGTGDAELFLWWSERIGSRNLHALDAVSNPHSDRVRTTLAPLDDKWPLADASFDAVISSQNIEHIIDTPLYLSEMHRVLKPGGYVMLLTENLASWANIAALVCGWMPFSLTNMFGYPFGNRLVWHDSLSKDDLSRFYREKLWGCLGHQRLFTPLALRHLVERHGFQCEAAFGAAYLPFFGWLSECCARLNPGHCHFIGIKFRKPL
ncbi:MAG: class I SAM-dependent methyltransferase [Verrucomicrobia bacterium]|nr:class I SAM-dependent methyltransferase [Verrucomicrobiota bacterium]